MKKGETRRSSATTSPQWITRNENPKTGQKRNRVENGAMNPTTTTTMERVEDWDIDKIGIWLEEKNLLFCKQIFQQHAFTGSRLLALSSEDLDVMGIQILGQRKKILRAVMELRRRRQVVLSTRPTGKISHSKVTMQSVPAIPVDPIDPVVPSGLLDGDYDEAASRASFAEALEEWRKLHGSSKIEEEVITLTNSQTETPTASNLGRHLACWQCYRCFPATQEVIGDTKRSFCSEKCAGEAASSDTRDRRTRQQQAELDTQRLWQLDISY